MTLTQSLPAKLFFGVSQLFGVSAGSRPWLKMDLQSEKVTSTCSQRFAELDPCCPGMLEAACESFRAGADASRLSLETLVQVGRVMQAEPARRPHDQTDGREGADIPRGQSLAVTVAASTRQTRFQQLTSGNCGNFCQLPSSLHVDGASK